MADEEGKRYTNIYAYKDNANLVLQAHRTRTNEPTGEAESLWGRLSNVKMGDRAKVTIKSNYTPKTTETHQTFQLILSFISSLLGDVPQDVLLTATDQVIATLKLDVKDFDKKVILENDVFGAKLDTEKFTQLINLVKRLTDFSSLELDADEQPDLQDFGVAVVFDDEGEDEKEFVDEIQDDDDEDMEIIQGMFLFN